MDQPAGMKGTVSHELAVPAAAGEVWAVYSGLRLGQLAAELLPGLFQKVELMEGDGGEGTVLRVTVPTSGPDPIFFKEKFVKIDDEKFIKVAEAVEGGPLDLGFRLYRVTLQIMEIDLADSCVIRSTIDYEIEEGLEQKAVLPTTDILAALAEAIGNYLTKKEPTGCHN
ncbi:hypothetical protein Taro_024368 [Colocasia esculenta]|uniref:Bet v I/Major latex protein domain-containing protein n=1 Tax=Colocasia esculenta TaxID=4460 RepID=A0A843VDG2_COLES|nr:hypothetical protein [Colocasia esculenta]